MTGKLKGGMMGKHNHKMNDITTEMCEWICDTLCDRLLGKSEDAAAEMCDQCRLGDFVTRIWDEYERVDKCRALSEKISTIDGIL